GAMHTVRWRAAISILAVAAITSMRDLAGKGHDRDLPLSVRLAIVETHPIDRVFAEDTYRGTVTHGGPPGAPDFARAPPRGAAPFAFAIPGGVEATDGELASGTVRSGASAESADTITIRRPRFLPLRADQLRVAIDGVPDLVPSDAWAGAWRLTLTYA